MERKKTNAATIAIAMCVPFERSGLVEGKIPDASVQTIRTKTTNQLQLPPNSIPAIRPRRKLLPIRSVSYEPRALDLWPRPGPHHRHAPATRSRRDQSDDGVGCARPPESQGRDTRPRVRVRARRVGLHFAS